MDNYLSEVANVYDKIKNSITPEQKEEVIAKKNIKEETIESITYKGGINDSISYREIFTLTFPNKKSYTLRISIGTDKSNPRDAVIYVFKDLEWKSFYSIPSSLLKTKQGLQYLSNVNPTKAHQYFVEDVKELKEKAIELLYLNS